MSCRGSSEDAESLLETVEERLGRKKFAAGRRQLDGQWQTIQPMANRGYRGRVLRRQREPGRYRLCTVAEETHHVVTTKINDRLDFRQVREVERQNRQVPFTIRLVGRSGS